MSSKTEKNIMISLVPFTWLVLLFMGYMIYFYSFSGPEQLEAFYNKMTGPVFQAAYWTFFVTNLLFTAAYE
jgi:hypothetical protein